MRVAFCTIVYTVACVISSVALSVLRRRDVQAERTREANRRQREQEKADREAAQKRKRDAEELVVRQQSLLQNLRAAVSAWEVLEALKSLKLPLVELFKKDPSFLPPYDALITILGDLTFEHGDGGVAVRDWPASVTFAGSSYELPDETQQQAISSHIVARARTPRICSLALLRNITPSPMLAADWCCSAILLLQAFLSSATTYLFRHWDLWKLLPRAKRPRKDPLLAAGRTDEQIAMLVQRARDRSVSFWLWCATQKVTEELRQLPR